MYLDIVFNEFHDLSQTENTEAVYASRALRLIISKFYAKGDMPYNVYGSLVVPVIDYGEAICGQGNSVVYMRFQIGHAEYFGILAIMHPMLGFRVI